MKKQLLAKLSSTINRMSTLEIVVICLAIALFSSIWAFEMGRALAR